MKKLLLFVFAAFAFAACEQAPIEEQSAIRPDVPDTITVGFEGDETRIKLNEAQKTVWTKGDLVSVFYRSNANQQWKYDGETGSRTANLKRVDAGTATRDMDRVVVVYPYNEDYYINPSTFNVQASLPATQHYLANSYGLDGNIMISSAEYNDVTLKNVCGWLKLQLTGDGEVVKSITFKGNNGEQVAGELYINSADATAILASDMGNIAEDDGDNATGGAGANLSFDDVVLKEVTLDCGTGVTLDAEATAFYIALPPQTFENGFKIEIEDTEGYVMEQSTDKALLIERNHIQPMAALEFINPTTPGAPAPASNEIWYTAKAKVEPQFDDVPTFGANVVSNVWDSETQKGIITFDGDVTMIGDDAFNNCDKLNGITIPEGVTTIKKNAFYDCDGLVEISIPDSVTTIGTKAFFNCSSLTEFKGKYAEDNGRVLVCNGTLIAFAPAALTEYTIPDSVTSIGNYAFQDCSKLTSVTIGDTVTTISNYAFASCSKLTSVTIGNSVTTISNYAFESCKSLTSITIGDSVKEIQYYAFQNCSSLTSVTIPDSVIWIGDYAFNNCTSLKKVYCYATIPPSLGDNRVFYNNTSVRRFYVYDECAELYKSQWSYYSSSIYGNGENCPNTTTIQYTTSDSETVTSKYLPIISNSYENGVGTMVIAGKNIPIPDNAFRGCSSLTYVTIPDSVTTIGDYAFRECSSLTSVTIHDSVTEIGKDAFCGCSSLASITIPDSVTTIGKSAFYECSSLTSVTIPNSVTTISDYAFAYCSDLTSVTIPDSVTTINSYAFEYCFSLTSLTIPDNVTYIGYKAFQYCTSLTSVYCKATVPPSLGSDVFYGLKIYVPMESVDAYKGADYWSKYASDIVGYDFENGVVVE